MVGIEDVEPDETQQQELNTDDNNLKPIFLILSRGSPV